MNRRSRAVIVIVGLMTVALAPSVSAAAPGYQVQAGDRQATSELVTWHQPDAWIRKPHRRWVGKDVYNSDGTNQQRTASTVPGTTVTFRIALQNDSSEAIALRAVQFGSTAIGYDIHYFQSTKDITANLVQGNFQTPVIQPGDWVIFRAEVAVTASAATNSSVSRLIQVVPVQYFPDSQLDSVRFIVKRI